MDKSRDIIARIDRERGHPQSAQRIAAQRVQMEEAVAAAVALYQQINGSLDALDEQDKTKGAESSSDAILDADTNTDSDSDCNTDLSSACSSASEPISLAGCVPKFKSKSKSKSKSKGKSKRKANRRGSNQRSEGQSHQLPKTKELAADPSDWDGEAWAQARSAVAERIERRRIQLNSHAYTDTKIQIF